MDITQSVQQQNPNPNIGNLHISSSYTQKRHLKSVSYINQFIDDVQFFSAEAKAFQDAGNLEETLAQYILLGATLEHLIPHCKGAVKNKYNTELNRVKSVLHFLHQKVQSKADSYYGCLDTSEDIESENELLDALDMSPSTPHTAKITSLPLECDSTQPVNTKSFEDITLTSMVGSETIKQDIIDGIVRPFQQPLLFKMRRSFLFYGPPGTGKTMFAKASANTLQHMSKDVNILFFSPTTDALKDKHVGGTERKITRYFKCVHLHALKNEQETQTRTIGVIFIDEIDSLARSRDEDDSTGTQASATNTLLQMMDGFQTYTNIVVMAATNYPWQLDDAVLSRFQEHIYVRLPDTPTIVNLLKYNIKQYYQSIFRSSRIEKNKLYEILSNCFDLDDNALLYIAKTFHQPSTYAPSNIRDVCTQVFRKNARHAQEIGVFYPILFNTNAQFKSLSYDEQQMFRHLQHRYASATTFQYLNKCYPNVFEQTTPVCISPENISGVSSNNQRKDKLIYKGKTFMCSSIWTSKTKLSTKKQHAQQHIIDTLQNITDVYIYLPETIDTFDSIPFLLYKPFHATFGQESHRVLQTYAYGALKNEDITYIQKYVSSSLWSIHSWLLGSTQTPEQLITSKITDVFFSNTHPQKENTFWSFSVNTNDKNHLLTMSSFSLHSYSTPQTSLDLLKEVCYTKSGAERYALWMTQHTKDNTSKAIETTFLRNIHFEKRKEFHKHLQTHNIENIQTQTNIHIQKNAFTLYVDTNWFKQVMDTTQPDAIRPTSQKKEIEMFEDYYTGNKKNVL